LKITLAFSFFLFCFVCKAKIQSQAKAYLFYNKTRNKIISFKQKDLPLPIASLTKLMTAYIVFEKIDLGFFHLNDLVEIGPEEMTIQHLGAHAGLKLGQKISLKQLLKAMLVASANDAAIALAKKISQSESHFVFLMNRTAKYLQMNRTHFTHPHGIYSDNHYSTAHDLLLLAKSLTTRFPHYFSYFSLPSVTINEKKFPNRNELLIGSSSFDGMKTGYTKKALYCLIFSGKKSHQRFFGIILGAPTADSRFRFARTLLETGARF